MAGAVAARAGQVGRLAEAWFQALTRQLHQAEARDLAQLHAGAVELHRVAELVFDFALMLLTTLHVDEVHDDEAAEVTQAQLARDSSAARGWC